MRIDRRFLNWGVFFILLGAVPLAVGQGWVDPGTFGGFWRFWPLILIGIGVGILLRRTALHFLGGLVVAAAFGLMFGSLLAGGVNGDFAVGFGCGSGRSGTAFASQNGTLGASADVELQMSCGDMTVSGVSGADWTLAGTAPNGGSPRVTAGSDALSIRSATRSWFGSAQGETWTVGLPTQTTMSLSSTLNAGTARLALDGLRLDRLSMTTNAGRTTIDMTGATLSSFSMTLNAGSSGVTLPSSSLSGSATVNAGSLGLCVPPDAALRIQSSAFLASNNFGQRGLLQDGSTWTSPGYDSAAVKMDLSVTANAGSVELDPSGGCR
jgi:LiaF transmembrane domain